MKRRLTCLLSIILLASAACAQERSFFSRGGSRDSSSQISPVQAEQARLATQLQSLQIAIEALQAQQEAAARAFAALEARVARMEQNTGKTETQEIIALKRDIDAVRQSQAALRTEIVSEVSTKIAAMLAKNQQGKNRPQAQPQTQPQTQQTGYSHKVERGQTLSEIAREYGKSVSSIMKANNLKDASVLREGQTLFIPD